MNSALEGVLHLFSETGTEGGYWAFQDSKYIMQNVPREYCKNCGIYLKDQGTANLKVTRVLGIDQLMNDDGSFKDESEIPMCEGAHEEMIGESWSYEGLHLLENGDRLTIYSNEEPKKVEWVGEIKLRQHDLFTESASGLWIHADQEGIERDKWAKYFLDQNPASLIKKP